MARKASGSRMSAGTASRRKSLQLVAYVEPVSHVIAVAAAGCACRSISAVTAEQAAVTARPISARRVGELPPARASTAPMAISAPAKAANGSTSVGASGKTSRTRKAPTDAPPTTPASSGPAKGLRTAACRTVPEAARQAPPSSATARRGARDSSAISPSGLPVPKMLLRTSAGPIRISPRHRLPTIASGRSAAAISAALGRQRAALARVSRPLPTSPRSRLATMISTGAPISAHTTPAGVSVSRPVMARPATSAASRIAAPHGSATASAPRWPFGRAARARPPARMPTNAIGPTRPTATAVSTAASVTAAICVKVELRPSARAVLSPSTATSSERVSSRTPSSAGVPIRTPACSGPQPFCSSEPAPHRNSPLVSVSRASRTPAEPAASARPTAMPARMSRMPPPPAAAIAPISAVPSATPTNATAIVGAPGARLA